MYLKKNKKNMRLLHTVFAVVITVLWLGANNSMTNAQVSRKILDFTGDGRSDWATLSATSATSALTWKILGNPASPAPNAAFIRRFEYGINGMDQVIPEDYRGDAKTDVTVWRRGTPGTFYVAQFPTGTGGIVLDTAVPFGTTGDILTAQGDYDGDGKVDYTVVRNASGVLTWYTMSSATGTMRAIRFGNVGVAPDNSPFRAFPGADFNADGRDEFVLVTVDINNGNNNIYNIGDSITGAGILTRQWGNFDTDFAVAPDDYTGDNRADFVSVNEATGSQAVWYILNPVANTFTSTSFGRPDPNFSTAVADSPIRGDYDGDGRSDIAVFRRTNATFYYLRSSSGNTVIDGQQAGDVGDTAIGFINSVF